MAPEIQKSVQGTNDVGFSPAIQRSLLERLLVLIRASRFRPLL